MDFDQARSNMIEQQIRTWEVLDQRTLDLFDSVHREDFLPAEFRSLALADTQVPIGHGQFTMTPKMEGRVIQALAITPTDRVLEIGTGCGFMTALLCCSAAHVTSIECFADLSSAAGARLERHGLHNVDLVAGDGAHGWPGCAPCDVIVVTGSVPVLTPDFERQLDAGGRLFVVVGQSPVMQALLVQRIAPDRWTREVLFETDLAPLLHVEAPAAFRF